jgi:lauroyl/myristoyl acyltransferase
MQKVATNETLKIDFQQTVSQLIEHDIGQQLLALATQSQLEELTKDIVKKDLYQFPSFIKLVAQHFNLTDCPDKFVHKHLEHLLWVQHRRALWHSGRIQSPRAFGYRLRVEGKQYLQATSGFPTILISPMTLAYEDILWMAGALDGSREIAMYGEGLNRDEFFEQIKGMFNLTGFHLIGTTLMAARKILLILEQGGLFLTYPDFVYTGHKVSYAQFFGMRWPFSSSFISICARQNYMLLPCYMQRKATNLIVHFEPPLQTCLPENTTSDPRWAQHLMGATIAQILEKMILRNPAQWLLLATLMAECHQQAS